MLQWSWFELYLFDIYIEFIYAALVIYISTINGIIYRHVYYFARYIGDIKKSLVIMPENNIQSYEISNIQWTSLEDARMLIRTYHCEKMEEKRRTSNRNPNPFRNTLINIHNKQFNNKH